MTTYKKDQGRLSRLAAFWLLTGWSVFGASALHSTFLSFATFEPLRRPLAGNIPVLGWTVNWALLICLAVFGLCMLTLVVYQNKPKPAELLIETENEMRKVTWPGLQEVINTSIVVVISVLFLMAFLAASDWFLFRVMQRLLLGGA